MACLEAWKVIPDSMLVGLLDTVRNNLLNFVLRIEAEMPDAGDLVPGMQRPPEERITQIFLTTIGEAQNLAVGSPYSVQNAMVAVQAGDLESLRNFLTSHGLTSTDCQELEDAIRSDSPPKGTGQLGPRVAAWLGNMTTKAVSGAVGVAVPVLTKAVLNYYGWGT